MGDMVGDMAVRMVTWRVMSAKGQWEGSKMFCPHHFWARVVSGRGAASNTGE